MPGPKSDRYFSTRVLRTPDIAPHHELLFCLDRLTVGNPPVHTCSTGWAFNGFYSGPTSIAYLFYCLSLQYPELIFKKQSLLDWAEAYVNLGDAAYRSAPTPKNCGINNEWLAYTAMEVLLSDDEGAVRRLCSYEKVINDETKDGFNDWRFGRAGYLYYLRLCKSSPTFINHTRLNDTIEKTVRRMLKVPQPWLYHGEQHLGTINGTIGIICQIVLSMPTVAAELQGQLESLLGEQFKSGNFPTSLPAGSDEIVQFCKGGLGFVQSLRSLRPHYQDLSTKIDSAISRAQSDIWRRGLLMKIPCLCHGIAGNALGLDDPAQFLHFLSFMGSAMMKEKGWQREISLRQDMASLFLGEAGRAWLWAVADKNLPKTCLGYNDV